MKPQLAALSLVLLTATSALALSDGPHFAGREAICTFGLCTAADGPADGACDYSSGAPEQIALEGFGFSLPSSVTSIDGIVVEPKTANTGCLGTVRLAVNGTLNGASKSLGGPNSGLCSATTYQTLGSASDTWGLPLTKDHINDDFGVYIINNACSGIGVDAVRVTVHFTIGSPVCGDGYITHSEACDDGNVQRGDGCSAECQTEAALDEDQQKCANALNNGVAKLGKLATKAWEKCRKEVSAGDAPNLGECAAIADESLAKAVAKFQAGVQKVCIGSPAPFGPVDPAVAVLLPFVYSNQLLLEVIGDGNNIAPKAEKEKAACQASLHKTVDSLFVTYLSLFNACKKNALSDKGSPQALSAADLEACVTALPDAGGKIAKAEGKIADGAAKKCEGQSLASVAPGECAAAGSNEAIIDCLAERAACNWCQVINNVDRLTVDCDVIDDGVDDGSCD